MNSLETRLTLMVQDILEYIDELEEKNPRHHILVYSVQFAEGTAPSVSEAEDFYTLFIPETGGNREDALIEFLAKLEDAVMEEREHHETVESSQPLLLESKAHAPA